MTIMRRELRIRFAAALVIGLVLAAPIALHAEPRRVLHVSLYPYIPDPAGAALALKQGFERAHPDVIVEISLNTHYYSAKPEDKGVLYEDADVHEIDNVFLRDFLASHKLQPAGVQLGDQFTPLAREAATYDGTLWVVPHWMCADFLIYRADEPALDHAQTLNALEAALSQSHGLLLNMKGEEQLGELYLNFLLASNRQDTRSGAVASFCDARSCDPIAADAALNAGTCGYGPECSLR